MTGRLLPGMRQHQLPGVLTKCEIPDDVLGCWRWVGKRNRYGLPVVSIYGTDGATKSTQRSAARVLWNELGGQPLGGREHLHPGPRCTSGQDCVSPFHRHPRLNPGRATDPLRAAVACFEMARRRIVDAWTAAAEWENTGRMVAPGRMAVPLAEARMVHHLGARLMAVAEEKVAAGA